MMDSYDYLMGLLYEINELILTKHLVLGLKKNLYIISYYYKIINIMTISDAIPIHWQW